MLSSTKHKSIHAKEVSDETRQKYRDNMNNNIRPKAIEWHKSAEGREWHKEQWKISLGNYIQEKIKMICINCGKEFETIYNGTNKFCSNNCKSAYRRKTGIDNEERTCKKCGNKYTTNKYSKRQYCDKCWKRKK